MRARDAAVELRDELLARSVDDDAIEAQLADAAVAAIAHELPPRAFPRRRRRCAS